MKLYHVKRTDKWGYDDYSEFVCVAETAEAARHLFPSLNLQWDTDKGRWYQTSVIDGKKDYFDTGEAKIWGWTDRLGTLTVTELGTANESYTEAKVIVASYHAG